MKKYDSIIIGSSPLSMLESIYLAEKKKKVLLIEKANSLGGAWRVESCFGLEGVEISPHVLLPNRVAYRILEKKFDIQMVPMLPPPVYIIKGKKRQLQYLNMERIFRECATLHKYKSVPEKIIRLMAALYHAMRLSNKNIRAGILYPEGGLITLLEQARKILEDMNIRTVMNEKVSRISYFPDSSGDYKFDLKTLGGNTYLANSVSSSAIISLDEIYLDRQFIKPHYFMNQSDHLTFLVKSAGNSNYGFAKIIDNSYFELVSDVSHFIPDLPGKYPGCKVITCRFQKKRLFENQRVAEYFSHLKYLDYLSADDELCDYYYYSSEDKVLASYMIDRLKTVFGDDYHFIGSRELGMTDSIDEYNARWGFVD